jgi:hypothetical protein
MHAIEHDELERLLSEAPEHHRIVMVDGERVRIISADLGLRLRFDCNRASVARSGFRRVIVAGTEAETRALRQAMPTSLRRAVIGEIEMPFDLEDHQVIERILPLAIAHERQVELDIVRGVIDRAQQGERGALGDREVAKALDAHRVRRLIIAAPPIDPELTAEFVRRSFSCAAPIEFVHGEAANLLREHGKRGGIAADLYWS